MVLRALYLVVVCGFALCSEAGQGLKCRPADRGGRRIRRGRPL